MVKHLTEKTRAQARKAPPTKPPEINEEEGQVIQKAAAFCVRHFPTLWTAGVPMLESSGKSSAGRSSPRRWIIPVILRYDTGAEGEVGSLAYHAQADLFTVLTDRSLMSQRARAVARSVGKLRNAPSQEPG
jgi:hypothetical protein